MTYNEKAKEAHYKWREANIDKYREYVNRGAKKYYHANREETKAKALKRYYHKKELETFMKILLD
jgi:hypothetical protein